MTTAPLFKQVLPCNINNDFYLDVPVDNDSVFNRSSYNKLKHDSFYELHLQLQFFFIYIYFVL